MIELTLDTYHPTNKRECGCRGCGRIFRGIGAFDKHRVGEAGGRVCATDLKARGLELMETGVWREKLRDSK